MHKEGCVDMKKYLPLVAAVGLLTACSPKPIVEPEAPATNSNPQLETEVIPQDEAMDLTAYTVDPEALFIEQGPGLDYFKATPYKALGEPLTVNVTESRYDGATPDALSAEVTLLKTEVFADHQGSGRLGIRLVVEEKNTSESSIDVGDGFTAKHSATQLAVFYGESQLKLHQNEVVSNPDTETYLTTQYVSYLPTDESQTCSTNQTLAPGESRLCHEVVSFAGTGEYLIHLAVDAEQNQYQTYAVTID